MQAVVAGQLLEVLTTTLPGDFASLAWHRTLPETLSQHLQNGGDPLSVLSVGVAALVLYIQHNAVGPLDAAVAAALANVAPQDEYLQWCTDFLACDGEVCAA